MKESSLCKHCKLEIPTNASLCHFCGKYQSRKRGFYNQLPLIISVLVSIVTIVILIIQLTIANKQTNLAQRQFEEARAKRIEAKEVLEKAKTALSEIDKVKAKADEVLSKTLEEMAHISDEIKVFGKKVNQTEGRLKSTEQRFSQTQDELSNKVIILKNELSEELELLKTRNELILLADKAKSLGDGASYDELKERLKLTKDTNLQNSIQAEIISIKSVYIGMTRIKNWYLTKDGGKIKPEKLSTNELIIDLLNHKKWVVRALVAKELGNRKVKGVPDALIKGMDDSNLDIRRNCLKSFEKITGFDTPDILDKELTVGWWSQNKIEVEKNLAEQ